VKTVENRDIQTYVDRLGGEMSRLSHRPELDWQFRSTNHADSADSTFGFEYKGLKDSRDDEREADRLGLEYAARAGYDPRQVSDLVIPLLHACAKNPVTGKREIVLVPESEEIAIGNQAAEQVRNEFGDS
jgi:hypothetical protein